MPHTHRHGDRAGPHWASAACGIAGTATVAIFAAVGDRGLAAGLAAIVAAGRGVRHRTTTRPFP
jgi:hypothetical protein